MSVHSLMLESEDSDSGSDRENSEKPEDNENSEGAADSIEGEEGNMKNYNEAIPRSLIRTKLIFLVRSHTDRMDTVIHMD